MIKLEDLTSEDIGSWVTFALSQGRRQLGRIKSFNDQWVFVVYNCNSDWDNYANYTAAATTAPSLTFVEKK